MIYGFIIAAGNQTRFNSDTPKALSKITGEVTCLDFNINRMRGVCDKIYVICSKEKEKYFENYKDRIAIESGKGCGDAVLQTLKSFEFEDNDCCFIQWGDSLIDPTSYFTVKHMYSGNIDVNIACRLEKSPYVKITQDLFTDFVTVEFSKFGEVNGSGFHDLSLFYGNCKKILKYCEEFYKVFYNEDHYEHKHGNEFNFLDVFNDTNITGNIVVFDENIKAYSFNTEEEYKKMIGELNG